MKFRWGPLVLGGFALVMSGLATAEELDAAKLEKGQALFMSKAVPACAVCHALQDAGAAGTIGPDLDALKPSYDQVRAALRDGVGVMPSFAATLDEDALDAVAAYVVHATKN